jgi:hypothetical protein
MVPFKPSFDLISLLKITMIHNQADFIHLVRTRKAPTTQQEKKKEKTGSFCEGFNYHQQAKPVASTSKQSKVRTLSFDKSQKVEQIANNQITSKLVADYS